MSSHSSLRAWMESAGLSHLTDGFIAAGVNETNFTSLTLADFDALGVERTGATGAGSGGGGGGAGARQRLFKLLQVVRAESEREAAHNEQAQAALLAASLSAAQAAANANSNANANSHAHTHGYSDARFSSEGHHGHRSGPAWPTSSSAAAAHPPGLESYAPPVAASEQTASSFGLRSFFDTRSRVGVGGGGSGGRSGGAADGTTTGGGGAADSARPSSSPTSSPPQRTLSSHILHSEREYLTLPLRANPTVLSPARTFQTPQHKRPTAEQQQQQQQQEQEQTQQSTFHQPQLQSHYDQSQLHIHVPPTLPGAAAAPFVARPMSPTAPALAYKYGSALNEPSASASLGVGAAAFTAAAPPMQQPLARALAWGSAAVSPSRPSATASLASSPIRSVSIAPVTAPAPAPHVPTSAALFHARQFTSSASPSSSPSPSPAHVYRPPPSVAAAAAGALAREQFANAASPPRGGQRSHHSLTSSPISPRSSAALHAAHSALERERDRQREERDRDRLHRAQRMDAPSAAMATPSSSTSFPQHNGQQQQQQQQLSHHRTLFVDQAEGRPHQPQVSTNLSMRHNHILSERAPHSVALARARNSPPATSAPSSSSSSFASIRSSQPNPSASLFIDDDDGAALERMLQSDQLDDADAVEEEEEEEEEQEEEEDADGQFEETEDGSSVLSLDGALEGEQSDAEFAELLSASALDSSVLGGGGGRNGASKIRVAVRTRPLNARELGGGETDVTRVNSAAACVTVHEPKQKVDLTRFVESHVFNFDEAFSGASSNVQVYARMCRPLVGWVMAGRGGRASCFAYGQTGAGKTHTLMGPQGGKGEQSGLYVLAARDIFHTLRSAQQREADRIAAGHDAPPPRGPTAQLRYAHCAIYCTYYELYCSKLFDLLNSRTRLVCRTDAAQTVHVVGLRERRVADVAALLALIAEGNKLRSTGQTGANADSSRSHAVLSISLRQIVPATAAAAGAAALGGGASGTTVGGDVDPLAHTSALGSLLHGRPRFRLRTRGKFTFIDLAGSERGADTAASDRRTRIEGAEINKSLLALKECIRALDQGHRHAPFRGSILTQVLKASLTGSSRTAMVACVAPGTKSCEHTLNTLRYADRVKQLKRGARGAAAAAAAAGTTAGAAVAPALAGVSALSLAGVDGRAAGPSVRSSRSGVDAYMPHQGRKVNKITMLPPDTHAATRDHLTPPAPHAAGYSAASSLASSPARPSTGGPLRPPTSVHSSPSTARPLRSSVSTAPAPRPASAAVASASSGGGLHGSSSDLDSVASLQQRHQSLCARILAEEESVVAAHRQSIDTAMLSVKNEMELLRRFDGPDGCTVDDYCGQLRAVLQAKQREVTQLTQALEQFSRNLKEEERLSAACKRQMQLQSQ